MRKMDELPINTKTLRAHLSDAGLTAVLALPFLLITPALWNGYRLLQWDTGGYLARWYEGYLVPSRSTVFGLHLHLGEAMNFWIKLVLQALATSWIIQTTLRLLGAKPRFAPVAISLILILTTALPWLTSMLLTDIFAGLSVLALYLLVVHGERLSRRSRCFFSPLSPLRPTAPRWASCSACAASASRARGCMAGSRCVTSCSDCSRSQRAR